MAFADSIKGFPIVKVVPLKVYEAEKKGPGQAALAAMIADALVSLKDIESTCMSDHNAPELKNKFRKLHDQLDSLKKYWESRSDAT